MESHHCSPTILTSDIRKLRPAFDREFNEDVINSLDFSEAGTSALCGLKNSIKQFSIGPSEPAETTINVKEDIGIAKFFDQSVLYTTVRTHQIRMLDLRYTNRAIDFPRHCSKITSLSPINQDKFMTASQDNQVKVWDKRNSKSSFAEITRIGSEILVACNPLNHQQITFAQKASDCHTIEIIDYTSTSKVENRFEINTDEDIELTALEYSCDGKLIMLNTSNSVIIVIDAENGEILHELKGIDNLYNVKIDACFTPCSSSKFVISGSQNGLIHCWSLNDSEKVAIFENIDEINQPCLRVAFNKKAMCLATASEKKFHLWIED